jgi:glycosyltransferase involved in cell wall biosynthesis
MNNLQLLGIVVIGRNEGERFKRCLRSLPHCVHIVYVDSGSTDGSVEWAQAHQIEVIQLDEGRPFTAARARNAGFDRLMQLCPNLPYVQFVDGDCELTANWPNVALSFLDNNSNICAVFGRLRERCPNMSVYNFLCDAEWDVPIGEAIAFGGVVMMRAGPLHRSGGYRDDLIAGEEPELAVRLRAAGWSIMRLDAEMGTHDAAITRFAQWWRRNVRSGFAFAEGAALHGHSLERHWVWEARRAMIWGIALPFACVAMTVASIPFGGWGVLGWLIFPIQMLRPSLRRGPRPFRERALISVFHVLSRFPEAQGCIKFKSQRWRGTRQSLIEYKVETRKHLFGRWRCSLARIFAYRRPCC